MSAPPWAGNWVTDRLGITLATGASATGLTLHELVGLAVRHNPRRAHLLVSTVLGKHVPTDPALVHGAGRLLGTLVAQQLAGTAPHDQIGGALVSAALTGNAGAARTLLARCQDQRISNLPAGTVVLGYAETATGLGHCVAAQLGAPALHSTRRAVLGVHDAPGFQEEHSHATSHHLLPADPAMLAGTGPLVLVDDELSTGTTAANTIRALHGAHPREQYLVAALVDLRSESDRAALAALEAELHTRIDVVALSAGTVHVPEGVLAAGTQLAHSIDALHGHTPAGPCGVVTLHENAWPATVPDGGRHGLTATQHSQLAAAASTVAHDLADSLPVTGRVHVLGSEELMYAPLLIADTLATLSTATVSYSTTTRSPVLVVDQDGYAITTGVTFPAHDDPPDGPGPRFAYNVPAGASVVLVVDEPANTPALHARDGLIAQLAATSPHIAVVTLPSHTPSRRALPATKDRT